VTEHWCVQKTQRIRQRKEVIEQTPKIIE